MSRYVHAADDAPLYRVAQELGGQTWPAYRVYDHKVVLDIAGYLVTFNEDDVTWIARPDGLPDWAIALAAKVLRYEADREPVLRDGWISFTDEMEAIPADALYYIRAWARLP